MKKIVIMMLLIMNGLKKWNQLSKLYFIKIIKMHWEGIYYDYSRDNKTA